MGADLFGSFAEATCAALVISSVSTLGTEHVYVAMMYPLLISAVGLLVCLVTTLVATDLKPARGISEIESTLKLQLIVSTVLATPVSCCCLCCSSPLCSSLCVVSLGMVCQHQIPDLVCISCLFAELLRSCVGACFVVVTCLCLWQTLSFVSSAWPQFALHCAEFRPDSSPDPSPDCLTDVSCSVWIEHAAMCLCQAALMSSALEATHLGWVSCLV